MSAAHTPGPWAVGPIDDTVVTHIGANGQRYEIADITGDYNQPDEWPVMEANARLIAAAPCLLEACSDWIKWLFADDFREDAADYEARMLNAMRVAIAKATGA